MKLSMDITTTADEVFSHSDSARMAALIYRRFGRDMLSARDAWQRLLENNTDLAQFKKLVIYGLAVLRDDELSYSPKSIRQDSRSAGA
jgi:hypothetical protein